MPQFFVTINIIVMSVELHTFLKQRDIIFTLCAAVIATQIVMFGELITNSCVVPMINKHSPDHTKVENFTINFNGAKLEFGKIFIAIIRLLIIAILLYSVYYLMY